MSNATHQKRAEIPKDFESLAKLYDEHAPVVLGFLEKTVGDKQKAEELLQAVFLALPQQLHLFDPQQGRFTLWILKLTRTIASQEAENKTKGGNVTTSDAIQSGAESVDTDKLIPLNSTGNQSVVELLYVKGYTFAQAAAELGVDARSIQMMVRTELKKYRR